MLADLLSNYRIILASKSPRRKELIKELGLHFEVLAFDTDESFPSDMPVNEVPLFLAEQKAIPFESGLDNKSLVITADTIVYIDGQVLGKPANHDDAFRMLRLLSGKWHQVATGVCILTQEKRRSFSAITNVLFKELTDEEIEFYISNYKPYDKAGAYGIQEWIGFIAVEQIEGSYFNVMGLPVQQLYEELCQF
jgi:septum formation protein